MSRNMNQNKLAALRNVMLRCQVDSLVLNQACNFAWLTDGGSSYINVATDEGLASLVVTKDKQYVVADNIETPRLQAEEPLAGWEFVFGPWAEGRLPLIAKIAGSAVGADTQFPGARNIAPEINPLRFHLDAQEAERFQLVGAATGRALQAATRAVEPGMSENQIAGLISHQAYAHNVVPTVVLVASDERITNFRHPLPTPKKIDSYAMLIVCGRRWGLIASATRLIHFGKLSDDLRRRADACAVVDSAFIHATRTGATLGDVFQAGMRAYAEQGFPDEWRLHHQGGLAGYQPREVLGTPTGTEVIGVTQAFAWNPSITGVKSEDTVLLSDNKCEIITQVDEWPYIEIEGIRRPDILTL
jgi:antitoxin VapB